MIGYRPYEFERDGLLIPAQFWLRDTDSKRARRMLDSAIKSFNAWQTSVTDVDGYVTLSERVNFLGGVRERRVRASEVHPYQCAGADVRNFVDLAFKLWLDRFTPFEQILGAHGLFPTFAILGLVLKDKMELPTLLRLNRLLTEGMASLVEDVIKDAAQLHARERTRSGSAAEARRIGTTNSAKNRREEKAKVTEEMRAVAKEYANKNPDASKNEIAQHVQQVRFPGFSLSTISKRISGVKREALQELFRAYR